MSTTNQRLETATHYNTEVVDGIDIFYREAGPKDAPVVLLLHGFPTSSLMFRNLIPRLARTYHVIAPDYPGFGHSGVPSRDDFDYSFDGLGAIIQKFLDQRGIATFSIYVMDFGAPVGFRLALANPDRISSVILQNAPLYPEAPEGWWETLGHYWKVGTEEARAASRSYLTPESIRAQYLYGVRDESLVDPDTWTLDSALFDRPGVDEIMLDLLYDIHNNVNTFAGMRKLLSETKPPILVATGANDEIFPLEVVEKILVDIPETEFHALDTGHFALEDRGDEIADLVLDFLDRRVR